MQAANYFDDTAVPVMRCPGRIRIKFPRLYRSPNEKNKIEAALAMRDDILSVYASPLTANVLIIFDATVPTDLFIKKLGLTAFNERIKTQTPTKRMMSAGIAGNRQTKQNSSSAEQRPIYPPWHLQEAEAALTTLQSAMHSGLTSAEANKRLQAGLNLLPTPQTRSSLDILFSQFQSLPVLLLAISAGLSLLTGGIAEAITIGAVLILNGGIGFVTERRAESTIASLSELIDDIVPVLRNGKTMLLQSSNIVPGDILILAPGVRIAADARLIQTSRLMIDESALTGESQFILKENIALPHPAPLADRINMAYMGTAVAAGNGLAVVVGTGSNTEIGAIQSLMNRTEHPRTHIQRQLDHLGNRLVKISVGICAGVFAVGILRGNGLLQMFKASISLAIAAVPEGLPTVATTSLARGLRIMRDKQMLIRHLQAVETLGSVHTICLDKTGTLTMNRMCAVAMQVGDRKYELKNGTLCWRNQALQHHATIGIARLLQICVLCNENAAQDGNASTLQLNGSATENALIRLALDAGVEADALRSRYPILHAELRTEGRNYMRTIHSLPDTKNQHLIAVKGNPMEVLALCGQYQSGNELIELTDTLRAGIAHQNELMAKNQLRVLGFAYAKQPARNDINKTSRITEASERQLTWLGLVGLADPIRAGAEQIIADLHLAGVHTKMITGDQRTTAYAIGKSLKLANGRKPHVFDTEKLDNVGHSRQKVYVSEADIFARVSPARKLQIVKLLQESGEVVAMTGDGINDGPALRASDVGIAMGLYGTDLARSAADVVLKNDQLESVIEAIRLGRSITNNIEKSLHFLISSNFSEILAVIVAISATGTTPLTPMQLLWINLLTDVLPAVAFSAEPAETDLMQQPPRAIGKPLIDSSELKRFAFEGSYLAGGALGSYLYGLARYGAGPRTSAITFNSLVLGQLLHAISCRSDKHGIFTGRKTGKNNQLNLAIGGSLGLHLAAHFIPGLHTPLGLAKMTLADMAVTLAGATIPMLLTDAAKKGNARNDKEQQPSGITHSKPAHTSMSDQFNL